MSLQSAGLELVVRSTKAEIMNERQMITVSLCRVFCALFSETWPLC